MKELTDKLEKVFFENFTDKKDSESNRIFTAERGAEGFLRTFTDLINSIDFININNAEALAKYYICNNKLQECAAVFDELDKDIFDLLNNYYKTLINKMCEATSINFRFEGFYDIETVFKYNKLDLKLFNNILKTDLYDIEYLELYEVYFVALETGFFNNIPIEEVDFSSALE